MSLAKLAAKARARTQPKDQRSGQKPAVKKSIINEDNYFFDFSINYRDVEKFALCKRLLSNQVGKVYGECSCIIDYGEHFVFIQPTPPGPEDLEDDFNGTLVKMQYQAAYSNYIKRRTEYISRCSQVYHLIWSKCTTAMQNAVKQDPNFPVWDQEKNALELWLKITFISINGTGVPENNAKRINEARHRFDRVHQRKDETVGDFYDRFNQNYDAMISCGAYLYQYHIPDAADPEIRQEIRAHGTTQEEEMQAIAFLNKLDRNRFGSLRDELDNALIGP